MKTLFQLFFGITGLLSAPLFAQDTPVVHKDVKTSLTFYEQIGGWDFDFKQDYGKGAGYSLQYVKGVAYITIYVYDMDLKNIPDGVSDVARAALDSSVKEMKYIVTIGKYSDLKIQSPKPDKLSALGVNCLRLDFEYDIIGEDDRRKSMSSRTMIAGFRKHIVKIRMSCPRNEAAKYDKSASAFLSGLNVILK